MSKKKNPKSEELNEQDKLNRRVDSIMDPKLPDPPLDIFKDAPISAAKAAGTAPEVSGKLLDKVDDEEIPDSRSSRPSLKTPTPQSPGDPPRDPVTQKDPLDDAATDDAVSDIASKEGNTLLALQDALGRKASRVAGDLAQEDLKKARHRHWAWLIFLVFFVIVVLLALPLNPHTCHWPVGVRLRVTTDILPSVCK